MNIPKIGRTITAAALGAGLLYLLQMFVMATDSAALDNPHIPNNLVNCGDCHTSAGGGKDYVNQGDQTNGVCGQCHNPSEVAKYVYVHGTPNFTSPDIQCSECHNPHYQRQSRIYKDPSYAATGTLSTAVGAVTATTVTLSAALPAPPAGSTSWVGYKILPDKRYTTFIYKIAAYDGNVTITIDTGKNTLETINTTYIKPGAAYAIVYGKLVKEYVRGRAVRFFKPQGTNSFADGDATIDGICQVCHTQTQFFKGDGSVIDTGHTQYASAGAKCVECHDHKAANGGFTPSGCTGCHGSPPADTATLIFKDKLGGAVTSGSPTGPGAHVKHTTFGFACSNCHTGGMLGGASQGDDNINLGFNLNSTNLGGTYKYQTRTDTPTPFGYVGGGWTTVINSTPKFECSNVYCHSTGQSTTNANDATPTYAFATWTTVSSGACGTCHAATKAAVIAVDSGSHAEHLNAFGAGNGCGDCHTGAANDGSSYASTNHVNRLIDVANSYTGWGTVGNGYGTCSTASCHGNVYGTGSSTTPAWGSTGNGCTACHSVAIAASGPNTGSHAQHNVTDCSRCHAGATNNTTKPTLNHIDGDIDVTNGYPANVIKHTAGSGYSTCSTTYCHGSGTPVWGGAAIACNGCHDATNTGGLSARHTQHYNSATVPTDRGSTNSHSGSGYVFGCGNCHPNGSTHATGPYDSAPAVLQDAEIGGTSLIAANYAQGTSSTTDTRNYNYSVDGTCSSTYCHSSGAVLGGTTTYKSPKWNDAASGACNACHNDATTPLATNKHSKHIDNATYDYKCEECHGATVTGDSTINTAAQRNNHVNGTNNVVWKTGGVNDGGTAYSQPNCASMYCHSRGTDLTAPFAATSNPNTAVTWNGAMTSSCGLCHDGTATGPAYVNGTPKTNSHNKHVVTKSYACNECHSSTVDGSNNINYAGAMHINKTYDVTGTRITTYTYLTDGGTCSTACHGSTTPKWGNLSTGCNFCHSNLPATGAHGKHVTTAATAYGSTSASTTGGAYDFGCGNCHPKTESTYHMNGTVDIVLNDGVALDPLKDLNDPTANRTGTGSTSVCNKVYCHSNGTVAGLATAVSLPWGDGTPYSGDTCGHCHGNQPNTGSHSVHVVGIHYNNVFNGITGTGLLASSGGVGSGAGHGDPNTATTINCNLCHNATVTSSANDKNTSCSTTNCHDSAPRLKGNATIAAGSDLHLNGSVNVTLATLTNTLRSKAQLRNAPVGVWTRPAGYKSAASDYDNATMAPADWTLATKTCATACHNSQSITWGESNVTCSNCHKGL